jgi:PAS domain S-box-containing protein
VKQYGVDFRMKSDNPTDVGESKTGGPDSQASNSIEWSAIRAFDQAAIGMAIVGMDGSWIRVNQALCQIVGYSETELLATDFQSITHPDDLAADLNLFGKTMRGEIRSYQMEKRYIHKKGHVVWITLNVSLILDKEGKPLFSFSQIQDITERKAAETGQRESEQRVRLLLDSTAEAIYGIDLDGNCTLSNSSCVRLLGYDKPSDLLGKNMHVLMHHTKSDGTTYPVEDCKIYKAFQEGDGSHVDSEVLWRKDGTSFPAEYWSFPILLGAKPIGAVVTFIDITERNQRDQDLRHAEEKYREIFDNAVVGIFQSTPEGRYLSVNQALARMNGYRSPQEMMSAMTDSGQEQIHPTWYSEFKRLLDEHGVVREYEFEFHRKDGSQASARINARLVTDGQGIVIYYEGTQEDITERKQLERQLRQAQKMEAVGQLAGGIAHDFNNLLNVIIGYSDLLLDRLGDDGKTRHQCEEIRKAGVRAAALTHQLLAFSRQQVLQTKVLNLNIITVDIEKMLRRLIGEDIDLQTILDPSLGSVKADSDQIAQVIMNLAVNARDAMPDGGKMTFRTANFEADESYAHLHPPMPPGHYVMLEMTDAGIGMDAETQAHMFEPFFTTKELGKGTGLGLATVYGVVKQSGGYIWVDSEPGKGSTFKIYLPRVDEPVQLSSPSHLETEFIRGSETILLVEDEASVRTLTRTFLEDGGFTVLEADSGRQALEISQGYGSPIHLLLTDVVMPGMNGPTLAEQLGITRPEISVLYMSGYTGFPRRGIRNSEANLLVKPFTRDALLHKVHNVLAMGTNLEGKLRTN